MNILYLPIQTVCIQNLRKQYFYLARRTAHLKYCLLTNNILTPDKKIKAKTIARISIIGITNLVARLFMVILEFYRLPDTLAVLLIMFCIILTPKD